MRLRLACVVASAVLAVAGCGGGGTNTCGNSGCLTSSPLVTSTTPASGATGVAVNTTVTAAFDMAMNASSLTTSTFTLSSSNPLTGAVSAVSGTVTYSSNNDAATFTPSSALAYSTTYTATITTGVTDSSGTALAANYTWSFTTAAAPVSVTAESPVPGATNVSVGTTVTATFSQAMNASTLTTSTFTLLDSSGNSVAGAVTYASSSNTATFTPTPPLDYSATYTATITTGAMDTNGTALSNAFTWQFTTAAPPPAPTVTSTVPANGATGVAVNTAVSATFSEAMNVSTITASTFTVTAQGGASVAGSISYDPATTTATFTPSANLAADTMYTATLTTGVTNSTGQAFAAAYTWSFTTLAAPTVLSTTPSSGATSVPVTTDVTATFSQAMNPATLTTSTFTLSGGGSSVTGTVTYSASSTTATFTPSASLSYNTTYTAEITTGAANSGGVPLGANNSWSFTTETAPSGTVTVDYGTADQIIRGFGGSTAWLGQLTTEQATALFSPTSGLGLSILRVRIDPTGTSANNWVPTNGAWLTEANNASEELAANPNSIVFASPWTPPASMKTSSTSQPYYSGTCSPAAGYCGGYLDSSNYAAYASYLNAFVTYFNATSNATLYAISMQNEPDYSAAAGENYESCSWTPTQMDQWIDAEGSSLNGLPLIMPESYDFNPAQAAPSLSDSTAVADISIVAGHLYGASPSYYTQAENAGKDVWMTEHYLTPSGGFGASPTIADALAAAEEVHNSMVVGQYNAYVWWWIWDDPNDGVDYGLINPDTTSPAPTYYGYAIGQFSKFIQPGYYRYNATPNPSSSVYVSAYSGTESGTTHYVIVAINATSSPVSQPFTIDNATVTSMTPWQTTSSGGLVQQSAVTVTGGTFTYALPAQSITTFVQ